MDAVVGLVRENSARHLVQRPRRRFSDETMYYGPWPGGVKFYARDSLAVLQEILENPGLADKCIWELERVTNGSQQFD